MHYFELDGMLPFSFCILFVFGILIIELLGLFAGLSVLNLGDLDVDADSVSLFDKALSLAGLNDFPLIMALVLYAGIFGSSGFALQGILYELSGSTASVWLAVPVVVAFSMVPMRGCGRLYARFLKRKSTFVRGPEDFVGSDAQIVRGEATSELAALGQVYDREGNRHFVYVKSASETELISQGTAIVLLGYSNGIYTASCR